MVGRASAGWAIALIPALVGCVDSSLAADFASRWSDTHDRVWIGPEYWANPMEDWRIQNGRVECVTPGPDRNVHLLTYRLSPELGTLEMSMIVGKVTGTKGQGSAGFHIGIRSELGDYRSSLIHGRGGVKAGITDAGVLFVDTLRNRPAGRSTFSPNGMRLTLGLKPAGDQYALTLTAADAKTGRQLGSASKSVPASRVVGNIAIVNNFALGGGVAGAKGGKKNPGAAAATVPTRALFWFDDWKASGTKLTHEADRAFGPILYAMHTISRSKGPEGHVLKMTAQMPPIGEKDGQSVKLQVRRGKEWIEAGMEKIDSLSRTATFRVPKWPATHDVPYRLLYESTGRGGTSTERLFAGTVRRDPVERDLVVAGFTGNKDQAFPNARLAENVAIQDPDVLFFSGDQIYEDVGGYGIVRTPPGDTKRAVNNYLRKIWLWGWAFRDLMRDRVTVVLPDDHDVYQGNIWGEGGIDCGGIRGHSKGGYAHSAEFVNAVHRTQVAHHPDLFDPAPVARGITPFYGELLYGRVSFAIIADRQFKSGPEGKVNTWKGRPDHVRDQKYEVKKLDKPGLKLLGDRQLKFLNQWAADWRGADAKCVLSQTIFCNLANYHGGNQQFIFADLDSNGWPQTGRNKAVDAMRRGFAFHLAGDQHLASIVHHGVESWNDGGYSFCVPSISAGYPRSWRPDQEGRPVRNRPAGAPANTGEYRDAFRNFITVHAVGNPAAKNRKPVLELLHD
ncbi:MAG: alkaline phosphatase D family protein, partial [Phycisphaerae bacterium]|nr:alkaline phosphatase D family protein [Phycisphaerae bacterium]